MILLCSAEISQKGFDALLFLAETLNAMGQTVAIDARFVPEDMSRHATYEATPYLVDPEDIEADKLVVVGADQVSDEVQRLLRSAPLSEDAQIWAFGRFKTRQAAINAANRVAYPLAKEPNVVDLAERQETPFYDGGFGVGATIITPDARPEDSTGPTRVMVYVPEEHLEDPDVLSGLLSLHYTAHIKLHVLTSGQGKSQIRNSRYADMSVFGLSDLPALPLLNFVDVVVFTGPNMPGPRMANLALHAIGTGRPVVDCTTNASLVATGAPVLPGPQDMQALGAYIEAGLAKNARDIGRTAQKSNWLQSYDANWLIEVLGLSQAAPDKTASKGSTVFFPTNGSGLGHAQRCTLIAEAMDSSDVHFAVFPSCIKMVNKRGFATTPMVQRSDMYEESFANDLVNFLRLRGLLKHGDQLVFDGGYVFDSIYRVISQLQISATWIRRGLWQPAQVNPSVLERERVFSRVIVPTEAFDELNASYTHGAHIHTVGPIVNQSDQAKPDVDAIKAKLEKRFGHAADKLVVSMLGGGVASNRAVQTQALSNYVEHRDGAMHLIVAWPNALVPSGYYSWSKSHVIKTQNLQGLMYAADLVVSAAGYNSFHEVLYNRIATIFVPQSAPFLDDQETRARAAEKRGLASLVFETDLVRLEQEVAAYLDGSKADDVRAALNELSLPETGNAAAARILQTEPL